MGIKRQHVHVMQKMARKKVPSFGAKFILRQSLSAGRLKIEMCTSSLLDQKFYDKEEQHSAK